MDNWEMPAKVESAIGCLTPKDRALAAAAPKMAAVLVEFARIYAKRDRDKARISANEFVFLDKARAALSAAGIKLEE